MRNMFHTHRDLIYGGIPKPPTREQRHVTHPTVVSQIVDDIVNDMCGPFASAHDSITPESLHTKAACEFCHDIACYGDCPDRDDAMREAGI